MFVSADCWMRDLRTACRYDELTRYAVPTAELYSVQPEGMRDFRHRIQQVGNVQNTGDTYGIEV